MKRYGLYLAGVAGASFLAYYLLKKAFIKSSIEAERTEGGTENTGNQSGQGESYAEDAKSQHFSLSEFNSKDGVVVPKNYRGNIQQLMNQLEALRTELGTPIFINSGYRSPAHNAAVGGVRNSYHTKGMAADIRTFIHSPSQIKAAIERLIAAGKMKQGGVGLYPTFVHYDFRGTKSRW